MERKRVLVIGLGIGEVYRKELERYSDYNILTIDPDPLKNAKYPSCDCFRYIMDREFFEMVIICTPNHLHEEQIHQFAPISKIVLVEKPGVESSVKWRKICSLYPNTRIIMVKNNMYRCDMDSLKAINYFKDKKNIHINWNNHNRIPFPGSWFTNKESAFGGVSYDLLPHLLHFMFAISDSLDYEIAVGWKKQIYNMSDITSTDYGIINKKNSIYNVDDTAHVSIKCGDKSFIIDTCWKTSGKNRQTISCEDEYVWDFRLCPDSAYNNMVDKFLSGFGTYNHYEIDMAVLKIIESLEAL